MAASALSSRGDLLFKWAPRRRRKRSIVSFLLASLAVHALAFYLFQIVYPVTATLPPPPSRVTVISPTNPEGRQLLRWLEAEDPAVAAMTQRPRDTKAFQPPKLTHTPTYLGHQPALKQLPPYAPELRVPNVHPPGPVSPPRARPVQERVTAPTRIAFSPEFETLGESTRPEMHFVRATSESPDAAVFRVAVNGSGEVRYAIITQSSGDAALDEQARRAIALTRFHGSRNSPPPASESLVWGTATIVWGNDVASAGTTSPPPRRP